MNECELSESHMQKVQLHPALGSILPRKPSLLELKILVKSSIPIHPESG